MSTFLTGIDHIQIAAPKGSEDKARAFYGEILGMEEIPKPENLQGRGGCWFKCRCRRKCISAFNQISHQRKKPIQDLP